MKDCVSDMEGLSRATRRHNKRHNKKRKSKRHSKRHVVSHCHATSTRTVSIIKMRGSYEYEEVTKCGCRNSKISDNSVRHWDQSLAYFYLSRFDKLTDFTETDEKWCTCTITLYTLILCICLPCLYIVKYRKQNHTFSISFDYLRRL